MSQLLLPLLFASCLVALACQAAHQCQHQSWRHDDDDDDDNDDDDDKDYDDDVEITWYLVRATSASFTFESWGSFQK